MAGDAMSDDQSSRWRRPGGRRPFDRWRLVAPSGVEVVSLRQLRPKERLRLVSPSIFTTLNMFSPGNVGDTSTSPVIPSPAIRLARWAEYCLL